MGVSHPAVLGLLVAVVLVVGSGARGRLLHAAFLGHRDSGVVRTGSGAWSLAVPVPVLSLVPVPVPVPGSGFAGLGIRFGSGFGLGSGFEETGGVSELMTGGGVPEGECQS